MMVQKRITRKVISKSVPANNTEKAVKHTGDERKTVRSKRACLFCQNKTTPAYTDTALLRRFITDRAKIVSHLRNNLCSKHHRVTAKQIKYARHLSLLPFTPKV